MVDDERGTADDPVLEGRGLYHVYRGREVETVALRGVDIGLAPGSWTSVMGPSGSGKSTLLNILAGLDPPTAGRVVLAGADLTGLSAAERARRRREGVGLMLQRDNPHPPLNLADHVAPPPPPDRPPRRQIRGPGGSPPAPG